MKNKVLKSLLVCLSMILFISLASCNKTSGDVSIVTIDINPSIEFIVDKDSKVVSVTALNDDGSVLIVGEVFVGKTIEEAANQVIVLAEQLGYLVHSVVNEIEITISSSHEKQEEIYNNIKNEITTCLEELNISGHIERQEALKKEKLLELAASISLYSEEELQNKSEEEIYKIILAGRIETALLISEEMREVYFITKEYEISFVEREETAKIIEAMGEAHKALYYVYKGFLDLYHEKISKLDKIRYDMLVSPDSEYQKALVALREKKAEILKQRSYILTLDKNGEEYQLASATLNGQEEAYDKLVDTYEYIGDNIEDALNSIIDALKASEEGLRQLEEEFNKDIKQKLTDNSKKIEDKLNKAKDDFFNEFEKEYQDDLANIEQQLKNQKEKLLNSLNQDK